MSNRTMQCILGYEFGFDEPNFPVEILADLGEGDFECKLPDGSVLPICADFLEP